MMEIKSRYWDVKLIHYQDKYLAFTTNYTTQILTVINCIVKTSYFNQQIKKKLFRVLERLVKLKSIMKIIFRVQTSDF